MNDQFIDKVRKKEVKSPIQRGFELKQWCKSWDEIERKSEADRIIYESGKIINDVLSELRAEFVKLYSKNTPKITNEKLIKIYFSISNRDRFLLRNDNYKNIEKSNLFSLTLNNNFMGNELTFQEAADGCVDGLEKALFYCKKRIVDKVELKQGDDPMSVIDFISKEAYLSQLYGLYESYWQALLWNGYQFNEINKEHKIYCIMQPRNKPEIGLLVSQIRKSRLGVQSAMLANDEVMEDYFINDKCIIKRKVGRKQLIKSIEISSSSQEIKYMNSDWRFKESFLVNEFPVDVLEQEYNNGFSIYEALNVLRCLMLLSYQYTDLYPNDNSAYNINKLLLFCPKINQMELRKGLVDCTGYEYSKVLKILNFIEYNAYENQDLWCHPIISTSRGEYLLLTSSLVTPVVNRVVEHWLVALNIDMQDKGKVYEKTVIKLINNSIMSNEYIIDFDEAVSKRIKLANCEEEIDLLARIGNVILIGEVKSIVTTDSPISRFRTINTLKNAARQVSRKTAFVEDNLESIFNVLGWDYDREQSFRFVKFIINSGRMYAGFSIDDVPVCDEIILERYFKSKIVPLISSDIENHLAWFELYQNYDELQENLSKYLNNPPQINKDDKDYEYKTIIIPCINEESNKFIIKRLVPKDIIIQERLGQEYVFPLNTVENIEDELSNMNFTV